MIRLLSKGLATFFGAGYFPVAPGTFASLLTALGYKFWFHRLPWAHYIAIGLAVYFVGVWAQDRGHR
jgi:phosphatidylglycerophosphatase A